MLLSSFLSVATTAASNIKGIEKLDVFGNTLLVLCQRIGFWIVVVKCIYDIIQCAIKGDRRALGTCILTYILIYASMFFVPWALRLVEGIF